MDKTRGQSLNQIEFLLDDSLRLGIAQIEGSDDNPKKRDFCTKARIERNARVRPRLISKNLRLDKTLRRSGARSAAHAHDRNIPLENKRGYSACTFEQHF